LKGGIILFMNQLEIFNATVAHETHEQYLFYANFTPELDRKIREQLQIAEDIDLKKYFGMYTPIEVNLKPPKNTDHYDFTKYFHIYPWFIIISFYESN
jgi:hypothetical protein